MRIFLDINVVLDFLDRSRKCHTQAVQLLEYVVANDYEICISEDMLTTIYYISRNKITVLAFLKTITKEWNILHFGQTIIAEAIELALDERKDLEDLLQCLCAKENNCAILITHDKTFYDCGITIYTAADFLKRKE